MAKNAPSSSSQPNGTEKSADGKAITQKSDRENKTSNQVDIAGWVLLAIVVAVTIFAYPDGESWKTKVSEKHVFYYGWVTAVSTGLGAIPFLFFSQPKKFWMGVANG
jgi:hypothetical protein